MTTDNRTNEPRRLKSCVDAWPECSTGDYNPACCRFPKSCSATVYSDEHVTEDDLESRAALVAATGVAPVVQHVSESDLAENLEHWIFQYNQERITLKTFARAVVEAIGGETPSKTA